MDIASRVAQMSHARRLQVGAVVVKDGRIISMGWNGMPAGWDNDCEDRVWMPDNEKWKNDILSDEQLIKEWPYVEYCDEYRNADGSQHIIGRYNFKSKPEVLHAERNALDKLAKGHESGEGSSLYVTHAPCLECAKSIYGAGIKEVLYLNDYRATTGIDFLKKCKVNIKKFTTNI